MNLLRFQQKGRAQDLYREGSWKKSFKEKMDQPPMALQRQNKNYLYSMRKAVGAGLYHNS